MNGEKISRQLNYLPEDMIAEAMESPAAPRRFTVTTRILRAAACFAVIIGLLFGIRWYTGDRSELGLLTVTVHATNQIDSAALQTGVSLPYSYNWSMTNWAPGLPITLSVTNKKYDLSNITFLVTVDGGGFYVGVKGGTSIVPGLCEKIPLRATVPNNTTIFWAKEYNVNKDDFWKNGVTAHADIIVYENDRILGYTVIRFDRVPLEEGQEGISNTFAASLIASVHFSDDDHQHASITEEYVRKQIEEVKAKQE